MDEKAKREFAAFGKIGGLTRAKRNSRKALSVIAKRGWRTRRHNAKRKL